MKHLAFFALLFLFTVNVNAQTVPNTKIDDRMPEFPKDADTAKGSLQRMGNDDFAFVPNMPEYPGGDKKMFKLINKNIRYPDEAKKNKIEGSVLLEFIVDIDGSITNIKPIIELEGGCTKEAIRVVKLMPKWKPGRDDNGKPVRVILHLPFRFQMTEEDKKKK